MSDQILLIVRNVSYIFEDTLLFFDSDKMRNNDIYLAYNMSSCSQNFLFIY